MEHTSMEMTTNDLCSEYVDEETYINDVRLSKDFKTATFSHHKKLDVRNALLSSLQKGKVECACHWTAELVCSGHFYELWDIFVYFLGRHVHLANPKMAIYLEKRHQIFDNLVQQYTTDEPLLQLRNNGTIRQLFAEVAFISCSSPQKPPLETLTIDREEEFDPEEMREKLRAPSLDYAEPLEDDPPEILVAINELAYHTSQGTCNTHMACFWVEWIIAFDIMCKTHKNPCLAQTRHVPVELAHKRNLIWVVWDLLSTRVQNDGFLFKIVESLKRLFCIKYTPVCNRKRSHLIYYAICLITEPVIRSIDLVHNSHMLPIVLFQTPEIYKELKLQEQVPSTNYLLGGTK